jgi:hypothetical protein
MRDPHEYPDQTQYLAVLPEDRADAARTAGLKRLSKLTWRVTELGAITAVGFATLFARSAPAQTLSSHVAPTAGATSSSPVPTHAAGKPHSKHHPNSAGHRTGKSQNQNQNQAQPTTQPGAQPTAKATQSAAPTAKAKPTLAPPTTAPAAAPPPSSAPAPAPTVSSASPGKG